MEDRIPLSSFIGSYIRLLNPENGNYNGELVRVLWPSSTAGTGNLFTLENEVLNGPADGDDIEVIYSQSVLVGSVRYTCLLYTSPSPRD